MNGSFFILLLIASSSNAFFNYSGNLFQNTRNISCVFSADLSLSPSMIPGPLWNILDNLASAWNIFGNLSSTLTMLENTISVWNVQGNVSLPNIFDVCFVAVIEGNSSNGTALVSSVAGGYFALNVLEEYVRQQCSSANFSPSVTPIGYGGCDPFPYQTFTSTLCICSDSNCNIDYATCMASVQAHQSSPPPNLQIVLPNLNNAITCVTNIQGATYAKYATGYTYLQMASLLYNISGILGYQLSSSTACVLLYNVQTGDFFEFPVIYPSFMVVSLAALYLKDLNLFQNYAESSTSVAIQHQSAYIFNATSISNLQYFSQILCICTTNNCNQNLPSCALGLDLSQITTASTTDTSTTVVSTTATPAAPSSKCFPGTSRVRREDGSSVLMRDVRVGDRLLVGKSTYSPVITFLVRQETGPMIDYLQIVTEQSTLEITPTHLILMRRQNDLNPPNYLQAAKLHPGDSIFISDPNFPGEIQEIKVIEIRGPIKLNEAYAPLTMEGTLIVDDLLVSCYAEYEHQSLVHFLMFPFRF